MFLIDMDTGNDYSSSNVVEFRFCFGWSEVIFPFLFFAVNEFV
jgi:hypothetical protein